jgi:Xaa-Pro aminopeptidase
MRRGDHICVLLESNGLGGYWTELARIICFGNATAELREGFELCRVAQSETAKWCRVGAPAAEVFERYNSLMTSHGAAPERRLHAHSQGHDMVERPLIREDETMVIEGGCNLAIHPTHATRSMCAHICDNYLIDHDGSTSCLHQTPKRIFEL